MWKLRLTNREKDNFKTHLSCKNDFSRLTVDYGKRI